MLHRSSTYLTENSYYMHDACLNTCCTTYVHVWCSAVSSTWARTSQRIRRITWSMLTWTYSNTTRMVLKYFFCLSVHVTDKISGNLANHSSCSNVAWDLDRTFQRTKQEWYQWQLGVSRNYSVGSSWPDTFPVARHLSRGPTPFPWSNTFPVDRSFRNMSASTLSVRGTVNHLRPSSSHEIFVFGNS